MRNDESGDWLDFFRNRLTIAILDENSNIVGFSGRALTDNSKSKYINSRESEVLINLLSCMVLIEPLKLLD